MKYIHSILFLLFFNVLFCQYIQVDDNHSAQHLIENILVNTPCASVSNITVTGADFADGSQSYGYFSKGSSDFPFQDGIILTTGRAKSAPGPNNSPPPTSEGNSSWQGDDDLEVALGVSNSFNATIIEFDFTPLANRISFDYIFASEQFLRNQDSGSCAYTDGFAFLLKEKNSSSPYENLAVLPGTDTPIHSNTVTGAGGKCPPINQQYFGYYNYDDSAVSYNGQTSVLTAQAKVTPGVTYHIKLVIADQGNSLYDSAIFLKGGSFRAEIELGEDRLLEYGNPLCEQEKLTLNANQTNASSFQWFKDGNPITGETSSTFTITPESGSGTYSVEVVLFGNSCISTGEIQVEYSSFPNISEVSMEKCDYDNDGKVFFDLNLAKSGIIPNPENYDFIFYNKNPDTDPTATVITNLSDYQNSANPESVFAKLTNQYGCHAVAEVHLTANPASISEVASLSECDKEKNGTAAFNLEANFPNVKFFPSLSKLELGEDPIPPYFVTANTTIYGILYGSNVCGIIEVTLVVLPYASPNIEEEITVCPDSISVEKPLILTALAGFSSYLWSTGSTEEYISITETGTYSVQISTPDGCSFTQTFFVKNSLVPIITEILVDGSTLEAQTDGKGNAEFSLDEIHWQKSPVFAQLPSGTYTIYIRNADSKCLGKAKQAVIFFIPNFFSPNDDGSNDYWNISGFDVYPEATVKVFNQSGKLVVDEKPNGEPFQWDGTYNKRILPQGAYWYVIKLNNLLTLTGWVAIKK
ncbi:MAG: choice-of-anchor L domain-containing protein [Flavobacteriaceae bacterium]|nr:choice-of-anchor L domain-containing protein [Flavobacteriaceae bacterium]